METQVAVVAQVGGLVAVVAIKTLTLMWVAVGVAIANFLLAKLAIIVDRAT
jgi:hypothetical protein